MTKQKSFKLLVRTRMRKTGESYTAARAQLLATAGDPPAAGAKPTLATSDDNIRARTGRGWEEWFDVLDEWGAAGRPHREIARWIAEQLGIAPLAWNAQAITGSYERVRGLRVTGQHPDGFRVSASKTIAVPVERPYDAFVDASRRDTWLQGVSMHERTATAPTSARFDWGDGPGRLHVTFAAKGATKSTVTVSHARLADANAAGAMKTFWREHLNVLAALLENGESDV